MSCNSKIIENKKMPTARAISNKDFGAMHQYSSPCRLRASLTRSTAGMRTFRASRNKIEDCIGPPAETKMPPFGVAFKDFADFGNNTGKLCPLRG